MIKASMVIRFNTEKKYVHAVDIEEGSTCKNREKKNLSLNITAKKALVTGIKIITGITWANFYNENLLHEVP